MIHQGTTIPRKKELVFSTNFEVIDMNHFNQKRFGKVCRICATESTSLKKMNYKETQYFELDVERFN